MKLVTFVGAQGRDRVGALTQDLAQIVDLAGAASAMGLAEAPFASMLDLIEGDDEALDLARKVARRGEERRPAGAVLPLAGTRLRAPVPEPRQMRDFLTFEKHVQQVRTTRFRHKVRGQPDAEAQFAEFVRQGGLTLAPVWYEQPIYYKCNRLSVIGPEDDVLWPSYSELLDYELEFGIFLKRRGRNIPRERAREHIFGFTIFNDMSARDAQAHESAGQLGPAKGKDFDTGNILGPWLVTADEIADPYDLTMVARVNGEEWSRGSTRDMQHRFEDMIRHVSRDETLHPGEFFGSGTVGNGCGLELDRWLKPGDVIELEVEGLGILRNRIVRA